MRINRILFTCSSSNWSLFVLIHSQSLPHSPRGTSQMPSIWEIPASMLELLSWVLKFIIQNYRTIPVEDLTVFWPGRTLKFWVAISHTLRFELLTWWAADTSTKAEFSLFTRCQELLNIIVQVMYKCMFRPVHQ